MNTATQSVRRRSVLAPSIALLAGAALAIAPWPGFATPAQAHDSLISSTPEVGSTITELPDQFSVTANESLLNLSGDTTGFALQVTDAGGLYYGDGCVTVEGASMSTAAALGEAGTYLVQWQIISADGHPVSDQFEFDWRPANDVVASSGSQSAPTCGGAGDGVVIGEESGVDSAASAAVEAENTSTTLAADAVTLSNGLWVGGILAAVVVAVLITLAVRGRKRNAESVTAP